MNTAKLKLPAMAALILAACAVHQRDTNTARVPTTLDARGKAIEVARRHNFGPPDAALVNVEEMQLGITTRRAFRAVVLGTVPPHEVLLAATDRGLRATSVDMEPVIDGLEAFVDSLERPVRERSAHDLARDLIRLGLGSQPGGSNPIENALDIPTYIENSDVYRDLRSQGLPQADIGSRLLRGAQDLAIAGPRFASQDGSHLEFWSWSYYGGVVRHWNVRLNQRGGATIQIDSVASGVGSFDLRM